MQLFFFNFYDTPEDAAHQHPLSPATSLSLVTGALKSAKDILVALWVLREYFLDNTSEIDHEIRFGATTLPLIITQIPTPTDPPDSETEIAWSAGSKTL